MQQLSHEVPRRVSVRVPIAPPAERPVEVELEIDRAVRAFRDALLLACATGTGAWRARGLLGHVHATAVEYGCRLARLGCGPGEIRDAIRAMVRHALATSGCPVDALRPIVEALGPLLDLEPGPVS